MPQRSSRVLIVGLDASRLEPLVDALSARGLVVKTAVDTVDALKQLPGFDADLLLLDAVALDLDLDTLARGVLSMQALEHLELLVLGERRPLSLQHQQKITRLSEQASQETLIKETERLAARARRHRPD